MMRTKIKRRIKALRLWRLGCKSGKWCIGFFIFLLMAGCQVTHHGSTGLSVSGDIVKNKKDNSEPTSQPADKIESEFLALASLSPKISEKTLKNGLRVVVVPFGSSDKVYVGVLYHVGSADDPEDKIGLSHFVEHMMFNGTARFPKDKARKFQGTTCLHTNASTGFNYTLYHSSCKKDALEQVLDFEADRLQHLTNLKQEFDREKQVILEEQKAMSSSDLSWHDLMNARYREYYLYSNYAYPITGYTHHIENISLKSVKKHYRKFYVPHNTTIVVVGNVSADEVYQNVEKYFGAIPKGKEIKRKKIEEPIDTGRICRFEKTSPDIKEERLAFIYAFDRKIIPSFRKRVALSMGFNILTHPLRMSRELCYDRKILSGFRISVRFPECNKASASISMELCQGIKKERAQKEFFKLLDKRRKFLTEQALKEEKREDLRSYKFLQDFPGDVFDCTLENIKDFSACELNQRAQMISEISLKEVTSILDEFLQKAHLQQEIYTHPAHPSSSKKISFKGS